MTVREKPQSTPRWVVLTAALGTPVLLAALLALRGTTLSLKSGLTTLAVVCLLFAGYLTIQVLAEAALEVLAFHDRWLPRLLALLAVGAFYWYWLASA
jgi:hypothetical protein